MAESLTTDLKLRDYFNELPYSELVDIWDEYCGECGLPELFVYSMSEVNTGAVSGYTDTLSVLKEVHKQTLHGSFSPFDNYFAYDGCGVIFSFNVPAEDGLVDIDDLISFCMEEDEDFRRADLRKILDSRPVTITLTREQYQQVMQILSTAE